MNQQEQFAYAASNQIPVIVCPYLERGKMILVKKSNLLYPGPKPALWVDSEETLYKALDIDFCRQAHITPVTQEDIDNALKGEGDAS